MLLSSLVIYGIILLCANGIIGVVKWLKTKLAVVEKNAKAKNEKN